MKKKVEEILLDVGVALLILAASFMMMTIGMKYHTENTGIIKQANAVLAQQENVVSMVKELLALNDEKVKNVIGAHLQVK